MQDILVKAIRSTCLCDQLKLLTSEQIQLVVVDLDIEQELIQQGSVQVRVAFDKNLREHHGDVFVLVNDFQDL
jgi:hypothetical protein